MENNGKGIFYGVIGVATLIVAIVGATFAFFAAGATNSSITGTTASAANVGLTVEKVTTAASGLLVPLKAATLKQTAVDENCVDANGNTACQIYKVTVTNDGDTALTVNGTLNLQTEAKNMKWQLMTDQTTATVGAGSGLTAIMSKGSAQKFADQVALASSGGTKQYFILVWLDDTGSDQTNDDAAKTFTGTVSFDAVGTDGTSAGITATFAA